MCCCPQETLLLEPMFDIPSDHDIAEVVIDEEVVRGNKKPTYVRKVKDNKDKEHEHRDTTEKLGVAHS